MKKRVAIIGAGMSGVVAAKRLQQHGHEVVVMEKSRGVGGRMSTRRSDVTSWDHGAQYFTTQDSRFAEQIATWDEQGCAALWQGDIRQWDGRSWSSLEENKKRYVGTPHMRTPVEVLAKDLDIRLETTVDSLTRKDGRWTVRTTGDEFDHFDAVFCSAPAEQSKTLLAPHSESISQSCDQVTMIPTWAVMLSFAKPVGVEFDGGFVNDGHLSWICRNSSKPQRPASPETWVLHARHDWSASHLDMDSQMIELVLVTEFQRITGTYEIPLVTKAHRWLFAAPGDALDKKHVWDRDNQLGLCGDWCGGPKVEGAFLSGLSLAEAFIDSEEARETT